VNNNAPIAYGPVQTVDLNCDGKPDVLLVEYGQIAALPSEMTVLLNQGNGRLSAPVRTPITVGPNQPSPVIVAGAFRNATAVDGADWCPTYAVANPDFLLRGIRHDRVCGFLHGSRMV
jgi:hypothetical protein